MAERDAARFDAAIGAIDEANSDDPTELVHRGVARPKELVHGEMMTEWVLRLDPDAGEAQLLAARAHHFRRWVSPRSDYPDGRAGYLEWRAAAKHRQANEVGRLLGQLGYSPELIDRVGEILRKQRRTSDPAVQTHEDALCLVFLDTQLDSLADRLGDDEVVAVLAKTIPKVSAAGLHAASQLRLSDRGGALLARAVAAHGTIP